LIKFVRETFCGKKPLWQAFWILSVGGYIGIFVIILIVFGIAVEWLKIENPYILGIIPFPFVILYFICVIPSVWRRSKNSPLIWKWLSIFFILFLILINIRGGFKVWTYWIPQLQESIGNNF
jgi:hypothetical protein